MKGDLEDRMDMNIYIGHSHGDPLDPLDLKGDLEDRMDIGAHVT